MQLRWIPNRADLAGLPQAQTSINSGYILANDCRDAAQEVSQVDGPLLEQAETQENLQDYSDVSKSNPSDSEVSDSETSDSEAGRAAMHPAGQFDSKAVDPVGAIAEHWSLRPSTATWLLQKPCSASREIEGLEMAQNADKEPVWLRAKSMSLRLRAQEMLLHSAWQGVQSAKEHLDAVRRKSWSFTVNDSCENRKTHPESVQQLVDMGFDPAAAAHAIAQAGENDAAAAVAILCKSVQQFVDKGFDRAQAARAIAQVGERESGSGFWLAVAILCQQLDSAPPTETPARFAASKIILKEQERVKATLNRAHASTLSLKRRAAVFLQSKFSKHDKKEISQVEDLLLEQAETLENQEDDSEMSDSNTSDSEMSDPESSDSEVWSIWSGKQQDDSDMSDSNTSDSEMSDSEASDSEAGRAAMHPAGSARCYSPFVHSSDPGTSDSESSQETSDSETIDSCRDLHFDSKAVDSVSALFQKEQDEENVDAPMSPLLLPATAEDQVQIGKADVTPTKLGSSEQTWVSKLTPLRGGA